MRGGRQEFLYSRVMCWVAIDRAIRLARKRSFPAPLARWIEARDAIYHDIFTSFWDAEQPGLRPAQGLARPSTPPACSCRWCASSPRPTRAGSPPCARSSTTWSRIRWSTATARRCRARRLPAHEGTFSMCSFWYAECLARGGDSQQGALHLREDARLREPRRALRRGAGPGEHLGNFPQAFTHLGLISAAYALDRALSKRSQ